MKRLLLLMAMSGMANAECYLVSELKGYSTTGWTEFEFVQDEIFQQTFKLTINGEASGINFPGKPRRCLQAGALSLFCYVETTDSEVTLETWTYLKEVNKMLYTKSTNGRDKYNGGHMLLGKVTGRCD